MPRGSRVQDDQQERSYKSLILSGAIAVFFFILIARLFMVQVIQAETNIKLSKENRMQLRILQAPRGQIFDRNGNALARNRPSYSLCILPYQVKNRNKLVEKLLKITTRKNERIFKESSELIARLQKAAYRRFDATRIKEDIPMEITSIIEEHSMELPGIITEIESRREYPLGPAAFHVLGYMGEIPEKHFDSLKGQGYHYGDVIGKAGLEYQYEDVFRGESGQEYVEVNAYGKRLGAIENMPRKEPDPGYDVYLTLDADLQQLAYDEFPDSLRGSVVMLNPRNGEVLCMLSNPSADPNIFSMATGLRSKQWAEIATDPDLPLNNRAIGGTYTPGSTFKLVSAAAGLASGEITAKSRMPRACTGAYRFGNRVAHCWYSKGHGRLRLPDAVKLSCNIYFYQLGLKLGSMTISKYAHRLGLGEKTGIDLPGERSGWICNEESYNVRHKARGWQWTRGIVLDVAIGQQHIVTPLQLACMIGALGNGSDLYTPFLVKEWRTGSGIMVKQISPKTKSSPDLDSATVATMRKIMESVVNPGGTGWRSAVPGIPVGGKTGSAEWKKGEKTHALFVACAPVYDPVVAIAVVVENAGHGGSVAAPIAGKLLRYYFEHKDEGASLVKQYTARKNNAE
ncbi:MAG: penicillin-binding protein 2 [Chitinivibrionales bacterium]|nr:penicillin-binding protein 2 [Chitinivibrionales bacterium]